MVVQLRSLSHKKVLDKETLTPFQFLVGVVRQALETVVIKGIRVGHNEIQMFSQFAYDTFFIRETGMGVL